MLSLTLAFPLALLPTLSLAATLRWMAASGR